MTKEEALKKIEELKKYVAEEDKKEEKVVGISIKNRFTGEIIFQSTKTTYKDAVAERLAGGANLRGANLRDADLHGANLRDADLSYADLRDAYLRDADLSYADLSYADLRDAYLHGANLGGTYLRGANLSGAELMHAKFIGKGGTTRLKKSQLPDFFKALGIIVED